MEKGKGCPSHQVIDQPGGLRTPGSALGVELSGKSRRKDWLHLALAALRSGEQCLQ